MKRFALRLVAVSSLLASLASGATRPQYGAIAHVQLRTAPSSLDPASPQPDPIISGNLVRLLFDTLVTISDHDTLQPALAVSWQRARDGRHWNFQLREGVKFEDGTPVTSDAAAASLRFVNPAWNVSAQGNSITIDLEEPEDVLPAKLALARNAIVKRGDAVPKGTGPFRISQWEPGKKLVVVANEEYWAGRPFLNSVEIEFGKTYRDQLAALQLGRAEVVEIPAEQARRIEVGGRRVSESAPIELLALVFANDSPSVKDGKLRDALALCIDRGTIKEVVLGGEGEPAGGMLPNWITGYGFLFPSGADVTKALEERGEVNQAPAWTLSYDAADPVSQVIAERIALNARDVGLRLQPGSAGNADIRLIRIRVDSENPGIALSGLAGRLGLALPKPSDYSAQALFQAENTLLQGRRVIPLFYLPANYGLSPSVKGWRDRRDGSWSLIDLWLGAEKN